MASDPASILAQIVATAICCVAWGKFPVSLKSLSTKRKDDEPFEIPWQFCSALEFGAISRKLNSWPLLPCILYPRRRLDLGGDMFDKAWRISEWTPLLTESVSTGLESDQWTYSCGWALGPLNRWDIPLILLRQPHPSLKLSQTTNTSVGNT